VIDAPTIGADVARPPTRSASSSPWRFAVTAVVVVTVAFGAVVRVWLLFHQPISSDEANAGMLAERILHGHFQAFYPGQVYGGAEFYALAAAVAVAGHTSFALHLEPMLFSVAAAVLVWRITLRLVRSRPLAALAAAVVFTAPMVNIFSSNIYQGRGLTMACGLVAILEALRLLDDPGLLRTKRGLLDCALFGLAVGLGWWSMPEITYFYPIAGLLILAALLSSREGTWVRDRLLRLGVMLTSAVVGALPWLWNNFESHFASLNVSSFNGAQGTIWTQLNVHFHLFFLYVVPMQLGVREPYTGDWFASAGLSWTVSVLAIAIGGVSLLICLWKRGRATALAVGVLCFPLLYSENPGTWYWSDGRYAVYLGPLFAMTIAVGIDEVAYWFRGRSLPRALRVGEAVMSLIVVVALALSVYTFHNFTGVELSTFGRAWVSPDGASVAAVDALESAGIEYGYADYWVAYKLDYLSDGKLVIDTSGIGDDIDRWPSIDAMAMAARKAAWIFVKPTALTPDSPFPVLGGPNGETEEAFVAGLAQAHIKYRIVNADGLQAVVARQVVPPRVQQGPLVIGG
jgi:4-amino-4-deoxy-L-arabinose transferase-like glycosyltransferase